MKSLIIWAGVFAVIGAILFGAMLGSDSIFAGIWAGCGAGCAFCFLTNRKREHISDNWGIFFFILFTVGGLISFLIYLLIRKKTDKSQMGSQNSSACPQCGELNDFFATDCRRCGYHRPCRKCHGVGVIQTPGLTDRPCTKCHGKGKLETSWWPYKENGITIDPVEDHGFYDN
jgi:ribosomal protein L40E